MKGWELVVSDLSRDGRQRLSRLATRAADISDGRITFELPLEPGPREALDIVRAEGTILSFTPIRETLEDYFLRRVSESRQPGPQEV